MAVQYYNRLGVELSWFCQLAVPTVWWLLWETAETKSKSSIFPGAGGRAVVTND